MPIPHVMPMPVRLMGGTFLVLGAILFGTIGVRIFHRSFRLRTKGSVADGIVVGSEERLANRRAYFFPKVEFQSSGGETIVFIASAGNGRMPSIGKRVKVIYLPDRPAEADIPSLRPLFFSFVFILFATGFLALSVLFYSGFTKSP
jgi:uncharacterized protein DUF3592